MEQGACKKRQWLRGSWIFCTFVLTLEPHLRKNFANGFHRWLPFHGVFSLQNTLIGCHSWSMLLTHLKGTAQDNRCRGRFENTSSAPKGNPVPLAVSSDARFSSRPSAANSNQARSRPCLGRSCPSQTLRTSGIACSAASFLPHLHLGEDTEIPGTNTTSTAASQMGLILSSPAKSCLSIKRGELPYPLPWR